MEWLPAGRLLEAGLGEGYGAALLAAAGHTVLGLDYDAAAVAHAAATYPRVSVVRGNVVQLPFADASVDAVVSMQVVEHLWDQPAYVAECARVLRPGGHFVISTPNRLTFSPGYDPATGSPTNPFHTREFSDAELAALLMPYVTDLTRYGLHPGPRLRELDAAWRRDHGTDLIGAQLATPPEQWPYALHDAVASVTAADFTLTTEDVDSSLDLLIHARRRAA
ncbi:MAG: methyltransferase domain-containing protein [Micromonosporaceae bacterium]